MIKKLSSKPTAYFDYVTMYYIVLVRLSGGRNLDHGL